MPSPSRTLEWIHGLVDDRARLDTPLAWALADPQDLLNYSFEPGTLIPADNTLIKAACSFSNSGLVLRNMRTSMWMPPIALPAGYTMPCCCDRPV